MVRYKDHSIIRQVCYFWSVTMMVLLVQLLYVGLAIKSILYKDHILSFLRVA